MTTQDSMVSLTPAELEAHLAAGQKLLNAKRAQERGSATLRAAQAQIASLTATAPASQAPPARPAAVAAPASAPPRVAWTSAQMDERVQRIVQSRWAEGRKVLAVMLCSSPSSIDEAIGVLKVSAGVAGDSPADEETVEAVAARIVAARKRTSAARPGDSGTLNASEIYARRRSQGHAS